MNTKTANRVGLYIQSETRDRLNALKERMGARQSSHVSQDDALNFLLDLADEKGWVGPYIQADTRARLNSLKDRLSSKRVSQVSRDDALNFLLDLAEEALRGNGTKEWGNASSPAPQLSVETVGQRIARLRKERGWTQEEIVVRLVALGVEVSRSYLSQMEKDVAVPGSDKIAGLARVFGVSADYLLGLTDEPRSLGGK